MKILFNLKTHCVETEGKKIYEGLIRDYLKKNCTEQEKSSIEEKMELLKFFLENGDFQGLRRHYPELSGGVDKPVMLDIPKWHDDILMTIDGKRIPLKKETIWRKF
ncbi:MAG: hypothetical protein KJ737_00850 [Proteobacteria bacterium]|nr:hypothetical protein [Pseudomonadota bacterium]